VDNHSIQTLWNQLSGSLFCGDCTAVRILIWTKERHTEAPQHAVAVDDNWYAIHCDYFKRRIEHPDKLARCGAHQAK